MPKKKKETAEVSEEVRIAVQLALKKFRDDDDEKGRYIHRVLQ